jgi:hypothetical protein
MMHRDQRKSKGGKQMKVRNSLLLLPQEEEGVEVKWMTGKGKRRKEKKGSTRTKSNRAMNASLMHSLCDPVPSLLKPLPPSLPKPRLQCCTLPKSSLPFDQNFPFPALLFFLEAI